ncbi:MAG: hypothetical protein MUC50_10200 [Myxococcota bacterium]|jgi:hypothetical protein|nr:hypothetical protein [Myxococcota bacterium]
MDPEYKKFVQSVIDNIKKHGFPDKRVAFPLERMYEIAAEKGYNFNKVLLTLEEIKIGHEKTPEKIIFYPIKEEPKPAPGSLPGFPKGFDPSAVAGMDLTGLMEQAQKMLANMTPEQLENVKAMYENMSDEEKAALVEQAKKLGMG